MEWQQILGYYNVVKLGSFTKAAAATFRSQSALSQQIKNLEEELGWKLIERIGKRNLRLTPEGEIFFRFSEDLLNSYHLLLEQLEERKVSRAGNLRIAVPPSILRYLFPSTLGRCSHGLPLVEVTVLERSPQEVLKLVRNGDVDFGIVMESRVTKDLISHRWKTVRTVLIVPKDHPLAGIKKLEIAQVAKFPLILPPKNLEHITRIKLENMLHNLGVKHKVILETSDVLTAAEYVSIGFGVCIFGVTKEIQKLIREKVQFVILNRLFGRDHLAVIMRRNKTLSPYEKAFLRLMLSNG